MLSDIRQAGSFLETFQKWEEDKPEGGQPVPEPAEPQEPEGDDDNGGED